MVRYLWWWAAAAALCFGCDDSRSRVEAGQDDRPDRGMLDGGPIDDAEVDATIDAEADFDGEVDALVDAEVDAAIDADPDAVVELDLAIADALPIPDAEPTDGPLVGRFIVGTAQAADGLSPVTVRGGGAIVIAEPDGRFVLGPVDGRDVVLRFSAPRHQPEELSIEVPAEDGETALPEPMVLYRGVRIGPAATGRMAFRFDEGHFLWEIDDALWATTIDPIAVRVLAAQDHEVFLGFTQDGEGIYTRRRTRPGVAGDIDLRPLDGSPSIPLFVEAQPWVREVGDRLIAMTGTREALSHLVSTAPGEEPVELDDGVPWLLVTTLAENQVAWAAGQPPGFGVFVGSADGAEQRQVSLAEGPTTDGFLLTTPDRRGLVWISPDGDLWRWPGEGDAVRLANDVATNPRPRLLRDGRVLFARPGEPGLIDFHMWAPDGERLLVAGGRPSPALLIGEMLYVVRPGDGLWAGDLSGDGGGRVLGDPIGALSSSGGGVLALVDGVAWRYHPDAGAEQLGGQGLSLMSFTALGATAWEAAAGALWFLPAPGGQPEATRLLEGAERPGRVNAPGGASLYALGADGWLRFGLPPADDPPVALDRPLETLVTLGPDGLLGLDVDDGLWSIDPQTGSSIGWAFGVERVERSSRNGLVAYVCDRGTFLVPVEPAD